MFNIEIVWRDVNDVFKYHLVFLETLLACLIDLISSNKNARTILDLTQPAHKTPP